MNEIESNNTFSTANQIQAGTLTLAADKATEGIETLNFSVKDQTVSVAVNDTSRFNELHKLSVGALSQQSALRLIELFMP